MYQMVFAFIASYGWVNISTARWNYATATNDAFQFFQCIWPWKPKNATSIAFMHEDSFIDLILLNCLENSVISSKWLKKQSSDFDIHTTVVRFLQLHHKSHLHFLITHAAVHVPTEGALHSCTPSLSFPLPSAAIPEMRAVCVACLCMCVIVRMQPRNCFPFVPFHRQRRHHCATCSGVQLSLRLRSAKREWNDSRGAGMVRWNSYQSLDTKMPLYEDMQSLWAQQPG